MQKNTILFVAILFCWLIGILGVNFPGSNLHANADVDPVWFDSLNVRFVGNWPFGASEAVAFDSARSLAFLGAGAGVYILDVSDSTNPIKISEKIHTRDWVLSLFFDRTTQRLYIANWQAGFEIWNTANPQNPEKLCSYHDIFPIYEIYARDSLAYVPDAYSGLHIFSVSDPMNPQEIGFCQIAGSNHSVTVEGCYAYLISSGLSIIDVTNPEKPELVGFWNDTGSPMDVCVIDTLAFIAGDYMSNGYVWILNVSDPNNPQLVSNCTLPYEHPKGITAKDSIVYVASGSMAIFLINASDPFNPFICGYVNLTSKEITVALPYAYVAASWNQGLRIINVANPSNPYQIGQYEAPHGARDVWVTLPYAYVADGSGGFRVLDISDAQNPYEVSFCWIPHEIQSVFVVDSLAYITAHEENQGLRIINIRDPFNPEIVGQCSLPGRAYDLFVKDTFAYVTDTDFFHGNAGFRIINISDPTNPYQVNYYSTNRDCRGIFVRSSLAYFTVEDFYIVDISDPLNIKEVGYYETPAYASGVFVDGDIAYVTGSLGNNMKLLLLDISDPKNPVKISSYNSSATYYSKNCVVQDSYVYVAGGEGGLRIIDVSSPSNPLEVAYYQTPSPGGALNTFLSDPYVYVAAYGCGVQIYQFYGAVVEEESEKYDAASSSVKLLQNPVRGSSVMLMLTAQNAHNVTIQLYNLLGQEVKTFCFNNLFFGENEVELSIDEIPTGVYFLRLEDSSGYKSEKVIILR